MRFLTFLLLLVPTVAHGDSITDLQNSTVVVKTSTGHGSGFLFTRTTESGKTVQLVWTAAHVVEDAMLDSGHFLPVTIIQGEHTGLARVLRCGDSDNGIDCALLLVVYGDFPESKLEFCKNFRSVKVGQKIVHCGTPYSLKFNKQIVTFGTIAFVNRSFRWNDTSAKRTLDQCDINAGPGSSGGPICDKRTGGILGLVIIRSGSHLVLIEKTASLYQWVQTHDCTWAFDRKEPMPNRITIWQGDTLKNRMAKKARRKFNERWESHGNQSHP